MATFTNEALNVKIGLWVKEESVAGTLEAPAAANAINLVGDPSVPMPVRTLAQNLERTGTLGSRPGTQLKAEATDFTFRTYMKPSGTAGTVPVAAALYKSLMGAEADGASDVVYSFAGIDTALPSLTFALDMGNFGVWVSGTVNQASIPVVAGGGDDAIVPVDWTVMVNKVYGWAGRGVGSNDAGGTTITLASGEGLNFKAGALIKIGSQDNSGAGYAITDVTGDVLTVGAAITSASSSQVVAPFFPANSEPTGYEVPGYLGYAQEDDGGGYDNIKLTTATIVINNNLQFRNDEKDGEIYAGVIKRTEKRTVTIETTAHFYQEFARYFNVRDSQLERKIKVPVGSVSGKICEIVAPRATVGNISMGGSPTIDQTLNWTCHETIATKDDEISLTFK